jgi:hypothetical protein
VLIIEARAHLAVADSGRAFRKRGPEAPAGPTERAERRVESVGEPAGRRPERQAGELPDEQLIEALDDAHGWIFDISLAERAEVNGVRKPRRGRGGQGDLAQDQIRQQSR